MERHMKIVFAVFLISKLSQASEEPPKVTDKVWFEISIGDEDAGRIEIGLFGEVVPKTVKSFLEIAKRDREHFGYKGTKFLRVIKGFMIQGGDTTSMDGKGGRSIYEDNEDTTFDDENFILKHYGAGWVSMANSGKNTNRSQFFITCAKKSHLDGKHVVFGKVLKGMSVVRKIEAVPAPKSSSNRPMRPVLIVDAGHEKVADPFPITLDDATE